MTRLERGAFPRSSTAWRVVAAWLLTFSFTLAAAWMASALFSFQLHQIDTFARALASSLGAASAGWWRAVTLLGASYVLWPLVLAIGLALLRSGRRGDALLLFQAMGGALLLEQTLKLVLHRARPAALWGDALPSTYSFPSGHALFTATLCLVLAWIATRRRPIGFTIGVWIAAILVPVAVGASRVGLGMHYATDVIGGYATAVLWLMTLRIARRRSAARSPGTVRA